MLSSIRVSSPGTDSSLTPRQAGKQASRMRWTAAPGTCGRPRYGGKLGRTEPCQPTAAELTNWYSELSLAGVMSIITCRCSQRGCWCWRWSFLSPVPSHWPTQSHSGRTLHRFYWFLIASVFSWRESTHHHHHHRHTVDTQQNRGSSCVLIAL